MTQYLVVAHKTLIGSALLDEVARRIEAGPSHFHLIVPIDHPSDHKWSEGECQAEAAKRLDEGLAAFAGLGAEATGEVGDQNPVAAIAAVVRVREVDEIILSTLPPGSLPLAEARRDQPGPRPVRRADHPRRRQPRTGPVARG